MKNIRLNSRTATLVAVGGMIAATSVFGATSASATVTVSTNCNWTGGLYLRYNSDFKGAEADICNDLFDYAGWSVYNGSSLDTAHLVFAAGDGGSAGAGTSVKNNAAAVANWSATAGVSYTVYFHSGYSGAAQSIPWTHDGYPVNLNSSLKNNNASQRAFA
ncbi:hypothetical protein ACEZDB_12285 [Streptacidiphilus sp. N1-3]|uniref:Peptidase inhibitor family I36 n=1 Tax=Streptacidiphilus alkalitolerans TaxID=3342712 RepID=A0ABV6WZE9_9ACTN